VGRDLFASSSFNSWTFNLRASIYL
jgi:hypothetical protein